jgi:hypothetical protein
MIDATPTDVTALDITPEVITARFAGVPTLDHVRQLERAIRSDLPQYDIDALTSHHFCTGMYARELFIPKGGVIVGKMHAQPNFFFLAVGEMTLWTDHGMKRVKAPFMCMTKPGDKRAGYAHEDSITFNFHSNPDDCTDLVELEARYITPEQLTGPDRELLENQQ